MELSKQLGGLLLGAALLAALFFWGENYGVSETTKEYLPRIAELETRIKVADEKAQSDVKFYKENENAIKKENDARVARINAHYQRLLQEARDKVGPHAPAISAGPVNGTTGEQVLCGGYTLEEAIAMENRCVLDAWKVMEWQSWAIKNKFPIGD